MAAVGELVGREFEVFGVRHGGFGLCGGVRVVG